MARAEHVGSKVTCFVTCEKDGQVSEVQESCRQGKICSSYEEDDTSQEVSKKVWHYT